MKIKKMDLTEPDVIKINNRKYYTLAKARKLIFETKSER